MPNQFYTTPMPNEWADEILLSAILTTSVIIAVACGLATRNLSVISKHIADHHKHAMDHFAEIEKTLIWIRDKLNPL